MEILQAKINDPQIESELNLNGYVVFEQLFNSEEVNQMLALYKENHIGQPSSSANMWNSLYDLPDGKGIELSEQLLSVIRPRLNQIMDNFKAPVAMLMSKSFGDDSECELHRDTSAFDESKFEYFNIWIPLVDTNEKNGTVYFIKGSNHFFDYPRPPALKWHYKYLSDELHLHAKTIHAKAGDCVVFLGKALHGSHPNYTNEYRPVVFLGAIRPEAELLFYYYDETNNEVRAYAVPEDFYFGKDFSEPVGKYPRRLAFTFNPPQINAAEISEKLRKFN